jgi:hypothetical protein
LHTGSDPPKLGREALGKPAVKIQTILVNYKTPDMTLDAVAAALKALAPIEGAHRVDVVDNDSQDGSEAKLREAVEKRGWSDRVHVHQTGHNGGFGYGNNFAIRIGLALEEPPDYVYLLNSDAFPEEGSIERLASFLESHPAAGIAGSYIHGVDGEPHLTAFRFPTLRSELVSGVRLGVLTKLLGDCDVPIIPMPSETRRVDWLAGASMMIRRRVLEEVGLFDETFFLYYEETDLCLRAARQGWETWYVVESSVAHVGSATTGLQDKSRRTPGFWFDSRSHYFRKNHGAPYLAASNVAHAAGIFTWRVRRRIQRKPETHAPHYLVDFVRHSWGSGRRS